MSVLSRLTPGATFKDPREGKATGEAELTLTEIGMAVGQLDWFAYDLVMMQHCNQFPANIKQTLQEIERLLLVTWQKTKKPDSISKKRLYKLSLCLWNDFIENGRFTDIERSNMCGMTDRHWRRGTNEVYKATLAELNTIASKGYRKVKHQLRADI